MIIVTGGAGFIGSNIVKGLNDRGIEDIIIVDNLRHSEKHLNLNSLKFKDILLTEDFLNKLDSIDNISAISHQGACSDTMETDGAFMMKNNYEFSKQLYNFCSRKNIKFIYASSASVYGNGDKGFKEERSNEYPLNIYAYSKYLFDQYVRDNAKSSKNQIVGLRYFNVYGPQENHKGKMASVFFHFCNQAKETGVIKVFEGSKNFLRDFVFVDDIVKINLHFLDNNISGIFNCGTGQCKSFYDAAIAIKEQFADKEIRIEEIPFPEKLKGKYQAYTKADLEDLRKIGKYDKEMTDIHKGASQYLKILTKDQGYYK
ncbi:MAG: ADP-glyceromanno-heptose 6-epimerase [Spirochaetes bacterium]|nr:ADP-glyceromanno-heptose 6-epimerase [Spirochaetota bacterium]